MALFLTLPAAWFYTVVTYESARHDKSYVTVFKAGAFAIFWTFCGYGIFRSLFSGEAFGSAYWSWFEGRVWDWSASGAWNLLGILVSSALFVFGYSVLVALTLCGIPSIGHSQEKRRRRWAVFLPLLALDYGWLRLMPAMLF